jgi:hypothetical protein
LKIVRLEDSSASLKFDLSSPVVRDFIKNGAAAEKKKKPAGEFCSRTSIKTNNPAKLPDAPVAVAVIHAQR